MNELRTVMGNLEEVALATFELDELELVHGGKPRLVKVLTCKASNGSCDDVEVVLIDDGA